MKLTISYQLQDFLKSLGADISVLLQKAEIPNKLRQEEVNLTSLEFYRLLLELDKVMSEDNIRALSQISHLQMFIPAFFASLASPNGLEALERFARFKKIIGPIEVDLIEGPKTVTVTFKFSHPNMELPKFTILNEQLLILDLLRTGIGEKIIPLSVESLYDYDTTTTEIFGTLIQKSETNRLIFDKK